MKDGFRLNERRTCSGWESVAYIILAVLFACQVVVFACRLVGVGE